VNRSFSDLATLAPTTGRGLNIAGGRATATNIRIDGIQARNMTEGGEIGTGAPFSQSLEAIKEFEIATNVYDVSQGRQSGGSINVVTKSGTNTLAGAVFAYHRNKALTTRDFTGREPVDFRITQWGASLGGPIVRDRLHYFFTFDRQDSSEPFTILDLRTPEDEIAAGVSRDSLYRMLDILQREYGLDARTQQVGAFNRKATLNTLFGRVDWALSPSNRLTLRHTYSNWNNPNSGSIDRPSLYEGWSDFVSRSGQTLVALQSSLGPSVTNDLKLGFSTRVRDTPANSYLPRGWVDFTSVLPNDTRALSRLQFGGNRPFPELQSDRQFALNDNLRFERGNAIYTIGTDNTFTRIALDYSNETKGLFEFASLADLEARRPFRYTRQVPVDPAAMSQSHDVIDGSAYAQGEFLLTPRLALMAGVRWDVSAFLTKPTRNPLLEQELGLRSDRGATDWNNVQPRAQVTWDVRGTGSDVLRAGAGTFTAQPHYSTHIYHLLNNGLNLVDVFLTDSAVPTPDFESYRRDFTTVPGAPDGGGVRPAFINVFDDDFQLPTTFKTDVAYQRRFGALLSLSATVQYARLTNNYHYFDRNLRDAPDFTLDDEGGRGVFVPASTINARGITNSVNSRKSPALARVLELGSAGELRQRALILESTVNLPREAALYASFTFNKTEDNTSYTCCVARTATINTPVASDPRDLSGSWGPSSNDFRHKLVVFGSLPAVWGFRASGRYVGQSGAPFSLIVGNDINGDDHNTNDLAFVFDPDDPATDTAVAAGMRRVLANPDNYARDYIRASLGRIASRNGGRGPWTGRLDVRLSKTLPTLRGQSAELIVDAFNFPNLLNRRWGGQYVLPARLTLLTVTGFDQATRRYTYRVNENVGTTRKTGAPYQIQAGVRYAF